MPNVLIKDRMLNHCAESELKFKREVIYYLIQEVETLTVPTVCCKIRKSVHSWYCGKYSHLRLAAPAQLDVPVLITTEDCKNMHLKELTYLFCITECSHKHFMLTILSLINVNFYTAFGSRMSG